MQHTHIDVKLIRLIFLLIFSMNHLLRTLKAFVELARVNKFTQAAESCHMTQSALSQAIARLEDDVGVVLFHRSTRAVSLTAEGERFLRSAKSVLAELDAVTRDLHAARDLSMGSFALAIVPSLAGYWLPAVLRRFHTEHPGVRIRIVDGASSRCHDLVQKGLVDLSLSSQPGSASELRAVLLFEEPLHIALPANHALSSRLSLSPKDLSGVAFIHQEGLDRMLIRSRQQQLNARQWLKLHGTEEVEVEVENLATLAGLVEAGFGACIAPACSAPLFINRGVVMLQVDPKDAVRPIYACHRMDRQLPIAATSFLSLLQSG